jgi:hypothetical protein
MCTIRKLLDECTVNYCITVIYTLAVVQQSLQWFDYLINVT